MIRLRLPAEWEPQSHVLLTWPHENTDWAPMLADITETYVEMAASITRFERLIIATPHPIQVGALLSSRLTREQMTRVYICHCKTNDTWTRDHGPITLKDDVTGALTMLDFRFNGWGEKFQWNLDNRITRTLFEDGAFEPVTPCYLPQGKSDMADATHAEDSAVTSQSPNTTYAQEPTKSTDLQTPVPTGEGSGAVSVRLSDHDDFVLEGGSIESDGKGTVFTTEGCLMAPHRNQPLTRDEIEQELRFRLKAKRIVWLHHGALKGDDTDGHIDTIVRIAPDDTLLYHKCYDSGDEQYEDFQALEQELMSLRTIDGKPYRLIPLPQPAAIYQTVTDDDGQETTERLPATYANFLIINGAVIVPTYGQPELDDAACNAIRDAFPDREIIPIDSRSIIRQHGSIHCCTMQIPLTTYTGGN